MALSKLSKGDDGFTFIEVLVGILIATAFVLIVTQAMVISVVFRVRAQAKSEALNRIQQDLEEVKYVAAQDLPGATNIGEPNNCKAIVATGGFAKALLNVLAPSAGTATTFTRRTTLTAVNKPYDFERTVTVLNQAPFNVLQIDYLVFDDFDNDNVPDAGERQVADYSTEVIPDEAYGCQ